MFEDNKPAEDDSKNSDELEVAFETEDTSYEVEELEAEEQEVEVEAEVEAEAEAEELTDVEPEVRSEVVDMLETATITPMGEVKVSALRYSTIRKNSASVAALQLQLAVCGYSVVRADFSGWFHDNTREAVSQWQADQGLDVTGTCTYEDMEFLFHGAEVKLI